VGKDKEGKGERVKVSGFLQPETCIPHPFPPYIFNKKSFAVSTSIFEK
jgi:hypothetical protein